MPFIESVPTTEYMIAVNLAPSSLSEPNDSRRPMAGPLHPHPQDVARHPGHGSGLKRDGMGHGRLGADHG